MLLPGRDVLSEPTCIMIYYVIKDWLPVPLYKRDKTVGNGDNNASPPCHNYWVSLDSGISTINSIWNK